MNQGLAPDIDDAHQTLKYTKAKMREVLAQISADQQDHGQHWDAKVGIL